MQKLTCIQKPQRAVGPIAEVVLVDSLVGSLPLEEGHLLVAVIGKALAHRWSVRGSSALEENIVADLCQGIWQC